MAAEEQSLPKFSPIDAFFLAWDQYTVAERAVCILSLGALAITALNFIGISTQNVQP